MTEEQIRDAVDARLKQHGVFAALDKAAGLLDILDAVLRLIESDPHQWSLRPCETCRTVSGLVGKPFGCERQKTL